MVEQLQSEGHSTFDLKYANRALILFSLLAAFVLYVDIMLTPSLPQISKDYNISIAQVSLIISLYTVFGTAVNPIVGKLGDIYGKKKILTYVLIIYCAMVTVTSFAPDFNTLLISRTFQGIGLAIFPLAFSLVREEFPRAMVPKAQGMLSAMFGAGTAIGLPAGAFIANGYGWQSNYHIATPVIVILTVVIVFYIRESAFKNQKAKMDYIGSSVLGLALGMIVFGLSEGSTWGWTSAPTLELIFGGALLFIPLVPFERRVIEPVLNFKLLGIRNVLISNGIGLTFGLAMFLAFQAITYQLELSPPAGYGFDIFNAGLYLLPLAVALLVVAYPVGVLISRVGAKPFLILGSLIGGAGFYLVSIASSSGQIAIFLGVGSVGLGMLMVATQNLLVLTVRGREMGLATSMNTVFRNIGSSLGAPIAGSLLSTYTASYVLGKVTVQLPSRLAFQYSYYIAVIAFAASLVLSLFAIEIMGKRAKIKSTLDQPELPTSKLS